MVYPLMIVGDFDLLKLTTTIWLVGNQLDK